MSHSRSAPITSRVLAALACLLMVGCPNEEDAANPPATAPATPTNLAATGSNAAVALPLRTISGAARYHLKHSTSKSANVTVFFDDFDGAAVDSSKWTVLNRLSDQVNGELDCIVPENITVQNGILSGVSKFEDRVCGDSIEKPKLMRYTSWHIQQKTAPFLYGTIEVRARMPGGTGVWPLIWMLGHEWQASQPYTANTPNHQWPNAGWCETDIAEFMFGTRTELNAIVHFKRHGGYFNAPMPYAANSRFMVYRLQWSRNALIWSVDPEDGRGFRILRAITNRARIPNVPMYVILSTAIGGIGGGTPDPATFPQTYQADWVRVTQ
jgi:beta-glucanase (GH16 family)